MKRFFVLLVLSPLALFLLASCGSDTAVSTAAESTAEPLPTTDPVVTPTATVPAETATPTPSAAVAATATVVAATPTATVPQATATPTPAPAQPTVSPTATPVPTEPTVSPTATPTAVPDEARAALAAARNRWQQAGLNSYNYTFSNPCFCPPEYVGPYKASVRSGAVVGATYEGVDLLDIEVLNIKAYSDRVLTVPQVFAEIERAITEADSFTAEYHPQLGYPTSVFIDWQAMTADEESGYQISALTALE